MYQSYSWSGSQQRLSSRDLWEPSRVSKIHWITHNCLRSLQIRCLFLFKLAHTAFSTNFAQTLDGTFVLYHFIQINIGLDNIFLYFQKDNELNLKMCNRNLGQIAYNRVIHRSPSCHFCYLLLLYFVYSGRLAVCVFILYVNIYKLFIF